MQYSIYLLTCKDKTEARLIAKGLLDKGLAVCVKISPVESLYIWGGKMNDDSEALLIIESSAEKFEAINEFLEKNHSYEEYVLTSLNVSQTTPGVIKWLEAVLR